MPMSQHSQFPHGISMTLTFPCSNSFPDTATSMGQCNCNALTDRGLVFQEGCIHFCTVPHISSSIGNFSLPWFSPRCCLLSYDWDPLLIRWVPQTHQVELAANTHNPYFLSGSSWAFSLTLTSPGFACKLAKKQDRSSSFSTTQSIKVFYSIKEPFHLWCSCCSSPQRQKLETL